MEEAHKVRFVVGQKVLGVKPRGGLARVAQDLGTHAIVVRVVIRDDDVERAVEIDVTRGKSARIPFSKARWVRTCGKTKRPVENTVRVVLAPEEDLVGRRELPFVVIGIRVPDHHVVNAIHVEVAGHQRKGIPESALSSNLLSARHIRWRSSRGQEAAHSI